MANRFFEESQKPNFAGLRIDYDHFSYNDTKPSAAAGWLMAVQNRDDGLWGQIKWSAQGESDVRGGNYRFLSPVWLPSQVEKLGNGRIRPLRLDSAGLTNNPNLRGMAPLSNRSFQQDAGSTPQRAAGILPEETQFRQDANASPAANANPQPKGKMKSDISSLSLAPDASEESVLAATAALKNRAETAEAGLPPLKNRIAELESSVATLTQTNKDLIAQNAQLLEVQVENDLEKFANRFAEDKREVWKKALLANRADTIVLLETIPAPAAPTAPAAAATKPMHNRAEAKTPPNGDKDFPTVVKNRMASDKITKGAAILLCTREHATEYAAWRDANGQPPI